MFWQFGEVGYDFSINFNDRVGRKPIRWDYYEDPDRLKLYKTYSAMINLRNEQIALINGGQFDWETSGPTRRINISSNGINMTIIGNFAVSARNVDPNFQNTGTWYDFFTGKSFEVSRTNEFIELQPGEFHIFTDVQQTTPEQGIVPFDITETVTGLDDISLNGAISIFPNPSQGLFEVRFRQNKATSFEVYDLTGSKIKSIDFTQGAPDNAYQLNLSDLNKGVYLLRIIQGTDTFTTKIIRD